MNKYIPTFVYKTVYDIPYLELFNKGKKVIFFDIDNTLLPYTILSCTKELIELNNKIRNIGYKIYFISNNNDKRINSLKEDFLIDGYATKCMKPSIKKTNEFIKLNNLNKDNIIFIGDQILTDIACSNNLGITSILVKSIDRKTEHWYTKINRLREKGILNKIKHEDYNKYLEIKELYKNE